VAALTDYIKTRLAPEPIKVLPNHSYYSLAPARASLASHFGAKK